MLVLIELLTYYASRCHIRKLCIHYKYHTNILAVGYTTIIIFTLVATKQPTLTSASLCHKTFEAHNLDLSFFIAINILDLLNDDISKV